jgi:ribosomal protein S18 acetylase RimI-like enzyme
VEACRPATADDIPRVVELAELMRAELGAMRGGALWLAREAWPEPLEDVYDALLARDEALVLLGTLDDAVIGFAAVVVEQLRSGARLGVITDFYVEPEAREVGVGEVLVDALVAHCRATGCVGINGIALPGQRATKNFFEAHGFTARALAMHRPLEP